jgi:hypothetical protein
MVANDDMYRFQVVPGDQFHEWYLPVLVNDRGSDLQIEGVERRTNNTKGTVSVEDNGQRIRYYVPKASQTPDDRFPLLDSFKYVVRGGARSTRAVARFDVEVVLKGTLAWREATFVTICKRDIVSNKLVADSLGLFVCAIRGATSCYQARRTQQLISQGCKAHAQCSDCRRFPSARLRRQVVMPSCAINGSVTLIIKSPSGTACISSIFILQVTERPTWCSHQLAGS